MSSTETVRAASDDPTSQGQPSVGPGAPPGPGAGSGIAGNGAGSAARGGSAPPASGDPSFLPRALAFALLLAFAYLWTAHHLGWKNPLGPGWLAGLVAAGGAAWKFVVERLITKAEKERAGERVRNALRRMLRRWLLAALYVAAGIVGFTVSSVTVVPEPGVAQGRVTVGPLDGGAGETLESAGAPMLRFPVLTTPFGRLHVVRADGYLATPVAVYPLTGARVRLGHDVLPSPSLLLRPSVIGLGFLEDGSEVRVWRIRGDTVEIARGGSGERRSLLLGRASNIPPAWAADWERELVAAGAAREVGARTQLAWKAPHRLAYEGELLPGDTIVAELVTPAPAVVGRGIAVIGSERMIDLLLDDVREPR